MMMYLFGDEFSVSSAKVNRLLSEDHEMVRGGISFFRWLITVFSLVLAISVFGMWAQLGDWETTSALNCFLLVGISAFLPTIVMASLVSDGVLSLYLCNSISPQSTWFEVNHKQFLR